MDDGDDEEISEFDTPSKKKSPLKKVQTGRVTKPARSKPNINYSGMADSADDEEQMQDDEEQEVIKQEHAPQSTHVNDYENGNGNAYGNGYAHHDNDSYEVSGHDEADKFYATAEDYGDEEV